MNAVTRLACRLLASSGAPERLLKIRAAQGRPGLVILAYHRVGTPPADGSADPSLFSATAECFERQMSFLKHHLTVLSFEELIRLRDVGKSLPANAAVITFDDGYLDNFDIAYPILRAKGLSAAIFLVTGMIGATRRMWWDEAAAILASLRGEAVNLPGLGTARMQTAGERAQALRNLRKAWKALPHEERTRGLETLRALANGTGTRPAAREFVNWEEVREMRSGGMIFGAHTHTHPILTQIPAETAAEEIRQSQEMIDEVMSQPYRLFAYPNGDRGQFNAQTRAMLCAQRFDAAVTLVRGREDPAAPGFDWLALKRVYVGGGDDPAVFAVKVSGLLERSARGKGAAR